MGFRIGFYALIVAVALLGSMGLRLLDTSSKGAARSGISAIAAPLSAGNGNSSGNSSGNSGGNSGGSCGNSSGNSSGNSGGDSCGNSGGGGNNGGNNGGGSQPTSKPSTLPTATPRPALQTGPVEGPCWFVFGFKTLHDLIPGIVGDCRTLEYHGDNGDGLQLTQGGLLVWRKADNWTAFTNGSTTWLVGPCGLQTRPNEGPFFSWEGRIGAPCTD